jgi:hypothetical protein
MSAAPTTAFTAPSSMPAIAQSDHWHNARQVRNPPTSFRKTTQGWLVYARPVSRPNFHHRQSALCFLSRAGVLCNSRRNQFASPDKVTGQKIFPGAPPRRSSPPPRVKRRRTGDDADCLCHRQKSVATISAYGKRLLGTPNGRSGGDPSSGRLRPEPLTPNDHRRRRGRARSGFVRAGLVESGRRRRCLPPRPRRALTKAA